MGHVFTASGSVREVQVCLCEVQGIAKGPVKTGEVFPVFRLWTSIILMRARAVTRIFGQSRNTRNTPPEIIGYFGPDEADAGTPNRFAGSLSQLFWANSGGAPWVV